MQRQTASGKGMTGVVLEKMKKATTSSFGQGNYMKKNKQGTYTIMN